MNNKGILNIAKAYSTNKVPHFFKSEELFQYCGGYRFLFFGGEWHVCFTNQWTVVDIPIDENQKTKLAQLFEDEGIPASHVEDEKIISVINYLEDNPKKLTWTKVKDFDKYVDAGKHYIHFYANRYISVIGFQPFPKWGDIFITEARDCQMCVKTAASDFVLHISFFGTTPKDLKDVVDVEQEKEEEDDDEFGGLFS